LENSQKNYRVRKAYDVVKWSHEYKPQGGGKEMAHANDQDVLFYAAGDIAPDRKDPVTLFERVAPTLKTADLAFCQVETVISSTGTRLPQARHAVLTHPRTAVAIKDSGFNVVSFAGNHCMDWGKEAFSHTIDNLRKEGIAVIGVGENITEARKPVIFDIKGNKIAFLAYNTILPMAYWAEEGRPGCVPLRAFTIYEQIEHDQPGTPCRIHTFSHKEDMKNMINDVKSAGSQADVVIVSMHFGIHMIPAVLAEYQQEMAYAAIDAGADLILGHHAHILKGAEVYKGKNIFYSLCNFGIDLRMDKVHAESKGFKEIQKLNPDWIPDFEALYNFPTDSQKTIVIKCLISGKALKNVSFLPASIDKKTAQPEILTAGDQRFGAVIRYMKEITKNAGLTTRYIVKGDEVVLE
jgi:poly-gamma-glutamate capsule biosynthesis protein CapA/YwtB (metallophosphatase superfamily)